MAGITLYDASIPVFKSGLISLKGILAKGIAHYGSASADIPKETLIEDLIPLASHVKLVSNIAKKTLTRIAGIQTEAWADDEDTAEKLIERCERTIALLESVDPKDICGHEGDEVEFSVGRYNLKMTSKEYVLKYAVPFFFFHLELAYSILRMKGVPLGFADYLLPHLESHLV
ncbi:hypothetical protein PFICI_08571 [Pestalotiopsis fici W106-1]|uniref:DUF1993 domain-containing protein n=1 Tax=Pestalotiopsis fici (strain W106-1 / CGMCC3.15140) TaxID=1229662 RepID=W3WXY6_PESFW|nr:uncharacterized protein PFICI_08571 [Pestalotiopsis fici W106-1]ETS78718.1 hypothetical protein PFICI_08571 [Pestalotiopsis fici W106-1]